MMADSPTKPYVITVSYGDHMEHSQGSAAMIDDEGVYAGVKLWREKYKVEEIYWRVEKQDFQNAKYVHRAPHSALNRRYWRVLQEMHDRGFDPAAAAVRGAHTVGVPIYIYTTILDEGCPPPYDWRTLFATDHPEYLEVDREQKEVHHGIFCMAYPEVRQYQLAWIKELMECYPADGLYISLRTHTEPAKHGDQFGFNAPIVEEFKRRHGVDILWDDFDLEAWRRLKGEYLTLMLREIKDYLRSLGRKLVVAMPRCARLGPPFGNTYLDWRTWVEAGIVDELHVGVISGRWLHADKPAGFGYVGSDEDNIGVPPLLADINQVYGPVCKAHGCTLHIKQANFQDADAEAQRGLLASPYLDGIVLNSGRLPETDYMAGLLSGMSSDAMKSSFAELRRQAPPVRSDG